MLSHFKENGRSPDGKSAEKTVVSGCEYRFLMSISKSERERAIFRSRRMYQTDLESNLLTAELRGEARGRELERTENRNAIARNLLSMNLPVDSIAEATGLTRSEVEALR